jgi:branched-chain amino acid transport system substrate-binding protein
MTQPAAGFAPRRRRRALLLACAQIVGEDTPIARELTAAMQDQLQSVAVGPTLVPVDTGKLSGLVSQIKASGAGFVYVAGPGRLAGQLGHRLRAAGNTARLVMAHAWPCWQKRGGAAYADDNVVAGTVYTCTCLPTERLPHDFRSRYRDAYGTEPLGCSAMAYDAANILLAALTAGAASRAATRAHVAGYSGEGGRRPLSLHRHGRAGGVDHQPLGLQRARRRPRGEAHSVS